MPKKKKRKKTTLQANTNSALDGVETASSSSESAEDNVAGVLEYSEVPETAAATVSKGSEAPQPSKTLSSQSGGSPIGFFKGAKEELDKVVWPDRQQLISESAAVILMVSFSAVLISLADGIFKTVSKLVF
jgi:preprotein translocase subunit SecE